MAGNHFHPTLESEQVLLAKTAKVAPRARPDRRSILQRRAAGLFESVSELEYAGFTKSRAEDLEAEAERIKTHLPGRSDPSPLRRAG